MEERKDKEKTEQGCFEQNIQECIDAVINLCGTENVLDHASGLRDEEYNLYLKKRDELVNVLCKLVRTKCEKLIAQPWIRYLPDVEFWEEIEQDVDRRTERFLTAIPYNNLDVSERLELLKTGFNSIFLEKESFDYLKEQIKDDNLVQTLYGVFMESEYAIVTAYVSKRRFMAGVTNSYGLANDDLEYIWTMFESNYDMVEKHEYHRRTYRLMRLVERIDDDMEELKEKVEDIMTIMLCNINRQKSEKEQ